MKYTKLNTAAVTPQPKAFRAVMTEHGTRVKHFIKSFFCIRFTLCKIKSLQNLKGFFIYVIESVTGIFIVHIKKNKSLKAKTEK